AATRFLCRKGTRCGGRHGVRQTLKLACPRCHRTEIGISYLHGHERRRKARCIVTPGSRRFRALFLSDVHLGTRGCQAEKLLDFLRVHDAETIYLVGDIVDMWQLRSGWYWPQAHNDVVQKLLRKARKGSRVIYVPGNHDEFMRDYYGTHFG